MGTGHLAPIATALAAEEGEQLAYELPLPPSLNHLYPSGSDGRRHISNDYAIWKEQALWSLKLMHPGRDTPPDQTTWGLLATMQMPDWRRRDLDGKLKALIDTLAEFFGLDDNRLLTIIACKIVVPGPLRVNGEVIIYANL